ncbi:MAG: hypothetical protein EA413_04905 [Cyanobium sp. PLM2.Bin73]|nr:MAG: hypothetical protein EA413_04905 [Cyanobium sp. PLM2.Bin73]
MPTPELPPAGELCELVAAAADLCRRPLRHGVRCQVPSDSDQALQECCLLLEARDPAGQRLPADDLELELYPSGADLHLTLAWCTDPDRPLLWHGSHPVWMEAATGQRCERPEQGPPLESLARRLRALLA